MGKGGISSSNKYQKSMMGLHWEHWAWFEAQLRTLSKFFILLSLSFFTSKVKKIKAIPEGWEEEKLHNLRETWNRTATVSIMSVDLDSIGDDQRAFDIRTLEILIWI